MSGKTLLVCGGAGFVGQNLVPVLRGRHRLLVIDKDSVALERLAARSPGIETLCLDLAGASLPDAWFGRAQAVVQLNAQVNSPDPTAFHRNNVVATQNVIEACRRNQVGHLVHVSSAAARSVRSDPYSDSKRQADALVRAGGVPCTILRPSMLYGLHDDKNVAWLAGFMRRVPAVPVPGSGRYPRQPVFVEDLCAVVSRVLEREPVGAEINIDGDRIDFIDMVRVILRAQGLWRPIVPLPIPLFKAMFVAYCRVSGKTEFTAAQVESLISGELFETTRWWEEFEVEKTPFETGLRRMFAAEHAEATGDA